MNRAFVIIPVFAVLAGFAWTVRFLYLESEQPPVVYEIRTPEITDITVKTVATGALVPREEVEIKPRVSGVIAELFVEPGDTVTRGQNIAKIQIIPDSVRLNQAEAQVEAARIAHVGAQRELERNRALRQKGVISDAELARVELEAELEAQELATARSNLQLVRDGASRKQGVASNVVTSTVAGTVLEVPVKRGASVIESNTFNAGTTIASVADMTDMIFQGKVDESEVGKLALGMPLEIQIGALDGVRLTGALEHIAPKGITEEGVIKFEIRAAIERPSGGDGGGDGGGRRRQLRAGYSANADIVLARKRGVLAIAQGLLQFSDGQAFVEVEVGPQQFERRDVATGLSDGILIEIVSGLTIDDRIKQYQGGGPGTGERGGGRGRRGRRTGRS